MWFVFFLWWRGKWSRSTLLISCLTSRHWGRRRQHRLLKGLIGEWRLLASAAVWCQFEASVSLTQLSALRASTRSPSSADSTSLWSSSMDQPDVSVSLSMSSARPVVHLLVWFKLALKHPNQLISSCDLQLLMKVVSGKCEWTFLINTPSNRHQ